MTSEKRQDITERRVYSFVEMSSPQDVLGHKTLASSALCSWFPDAALFARQRVYGFCARYICTRADELQHGLELIKISSLIIGKQGSGSACCSIRHWHNEIPRCLLRFFAMLRFRLAVLWQKWKSSMLFAVIYLVLVFLTEISYKTKNNLAKFMNEVYSFT